jgi:hypothetical protein
MTTKAPALTPAPAELAAFLATTRPDHTHTDWNGAVYAAHNAWAWERVVREVWGLLHRGEDPADLRAACADPRKRTPTTRKDHT